MLSLRHYLPALADAGCTGALRVTGRPGGVLYLVAGRIAYAESPACPGLGERLVRSGRLSARAWHEAVEEGRRDCRVGVVLVRDGHLGRGELAARVHATIAAVTRVLLNAEDGPVRWVPGERHWLGLGAAALVMEET